MKRSLFAPPDTFSLQPFLACLPVIGSVQELKKMSTALYARYEKVSVMRKEIGQDVHGAGSQRLLAEEAMLKQVLDWLATNGELLR